MSRSSTGSSPTTSPQCITSGGMCSNPPGHDALVADVEPDVPGKNVDDLLVGVLVRPRLMPRHQLVQRHGRAVAGEGLAHDAFARRFPRDAFLVDLVKARRVSGCVPARRLGAVARGVNTAARVTQS